MTHFSATFQMPLSLPRPDYVAESLTEIKLPHPGRQSVAEQWPRLLVGAAELRPSLAQVQSSIDEQILSLP